MDAHVAHFVGRRIAAEDLPAVRRWFLRRKLARGQLADWRATLRALQLDKAQAAVLQREWPAGRGRV